METVVLAPVLMVLVLFVIYVGRYSAAASQVVHAADQAARAASMVAPARMAGVAREVALADLGDNGVSCTDPQVLVATGSQGQTATITVRVTCRVARAQLAPLAPGDQTVSGESTEVIDRHRGGA